MIEFLIVMLVLKNLFVRVVMLLLSLPFYTVSFRFLKRSFVCESL